MMKASRDSENETEINFSVAFSISNTYSSKFGFYRLTANFSSNTCSPRPFVQIVIYMLDTTHFLET